MTERKKIHVCSCSFGKDSLAMLLRLIELGRQIDLVVFFDTGMEFGAIYRLRDKIVALLNELGIKYVELRAETPFWIQMLIKEVNPGTAKAHFGYEWCGGMCRWGTSDKVRMCQKYYAENYPNCEIYEYVGIAADEPKRIKDDEHKIYPLVEWKMTENMCLAYCRHKGYNWIEDGVDLYDILDRVSCWCCCNKNLKELKNIYHYLPKYWGYLKGLQSRIDRPFRRSGKEKTIFELEERFKREIEEEKEKLKTIDIVDNYKYQQLSFKDVFKEEYL